MKTLVEQAQERISTLPFASNKKEIDDMMKLSQDEFLLVYDSMSKKEYKEFLGVICFDKKVAEHLDDKLVGDPNSKLNGLYDNGYTLREFIIELYPVGWKDAFKNFDFDTINTLLESHGLKQFDQNTVIKPDKYIADGGKTTSKAEELIKAYKSQVKE